LGFIFANKKDERDLPAQKSSAIHFQLKACNCQVTVIPAELLSHQYSGISVTSNTEEWMFS